MRECVQVRSDSKAAAVSVGRAPVVGAWPGRYQSEAAATAAAVLRGAVRPGGLGAAGGGICAGRARPPGGAALLLNESECRKCINQRINKRRGWS